MTNLKSITFLAITAIASSLMLSCGTHMSIVKRHHSKGYYVDFGKDKPNAPALKQQKEEEPKEMSEDLYASTSNDNNGYDASLLKKNKTQPEKEVATVEKKKNHFTKVRLPLSTPFKIQRMHKQLGHDTTVAPSSSSDDALSLLWLIIVVLIILWALGFLFSGFGMGPLIHLLLVIALILLILWLLRII